MHPLLRAVKPLTEALGAEIVPLSKLRDGDIELTWEDEVVGGVRLPERPRDIEWFLAAAERQFDGPLSSLDHVEKQRVDQDAQRRGAFQACASRWSRSPRCWASVGSRSTTT